MDEGDEVDCAACGTWFCFHDTSPTHEFASVKRLCSTCYEEGLAYLHGDDPLPTPDYMRIAVAPEGRRGFTADGITSETPRSMLLEYTPSGGLMRFDQLDEAGALLVEWLEKAGCLVLAWRSRNATHKPENRKQGKGKQSGCIQTYMRPHDLAGLPGDGRSIFEFKNNAGYGMLYEVRNPKWGVNRICESARLTLKHTIARHIQ